MMPAVRARAGSRLEGSSVDVDIVSELSWVKAYFFNPAPRVLLAKATRKPLMVLSDAALEGQMTHWPQWGPWCWTGMVQFFNLRLDQKQLASLQAETTKLISV